MWNGKKLMLLTWCSTSWTAKPFKSDQSNWNVNMFPENPRCSWGGIWKTEKMTGMWDGSSWGIDGGWPTISNHSPPSSKALPICQYSCFLTFHPFYILICLYSLPTVDPNDLIHSKVESINHRDKVFIGVFWRLYLKLLLSSMKKKETQWINHSNIRRWDVSKSSLLKLFC